MSEASYVVGIDLGTTNSIVAFAAADADPDDPGAINVLPIAQITAPGAIERRRVLPSFIWMPAAHQVGPDGLRLPWGGPETRVVGEYARERGAETPDRLIASAKSWLCHEMVDRHAPILPWEGPDDIEKLSPVAASADLLSHIRHAWNSEIAGNDPQMMLENQQIMLTVPASFDAVARELTVKAAAMAGLERVTLLEEPQAAFYAWIANSGQRWRDVVQKNDIILVCDIGGGTSDFSMIRVGERSGELTLERIAVGDHLLVGGDNMDLALAVQVARQLSESGSPPDTWQMRALSHTCRKAKENLFAGDGVPSVPVAVVGRGRSLIGGTRRTELFLETVTATIVEGFFPRCDWSSNPVSLNRAGLQELGLVYASDPAITRHLAKFLRVGSADAADRSFPNKVLFNGGVMKAGPIRKRILETVAGWKDDQTEGRRGLREIISDDFDLSVARGAAYYGLARRGKGIRIKSGLGRSYYMGVAAAMPAIPGMPPPIKALCVAPFGMEEGEQAVLDDREFVLIVGETVRFDILSSSSRHEDMPGILVESWRPEEIEPLTTIETELDGAEGATVPVYFEVITTEVGTLEFWCVSKEDGRRWKLEFNVREK